MNYLNFDIWFEKHSIDGLPMPDLRDEGRYDKLTVPPSGTEWVFMSLSESISPLQKFLVTVLLVTGFVVGGAVFFDARFISTSELAVLFEKSNGELTALRDELERVRIETETLLQNAGEETKREVDTRLAEEAKKLASVEEKLSQESFERSKAESQIRALTGLSESKIFELERKLSNSQYNVTQVISSWRPRTASVICSFGLNKQSGSGTLYRYTEGGAEKFAVLTNRHLVIDSKNISASSCALRFPDHDTTYTGSRAAGDIEISSDGYDFGRIIITNPSQYLRGIATSNVSFCSSRAAIGDEIIILGYPLIGSQEDITATDGIISGYDSDYYITSAKVEQGNSGGTAVLLSKNCLLGIPTFVQLGTLEALARILDIDVVMR